MITAVDTNVLLDILIPDSQHALASKGRLDEANISGGIVISEVVYAELSSQFQYQKALDSFLSETGIRLIPAGREALYRAGLVWRGYANLSRHVSKREIKKGILQCQGCGNKTIIPHCSRCGAAISVRQHIISDFIIGAHALCHADRLLTRDRGYYKTYFRELVLF